MNNISREDVLSFGDYFCFIEMFQIVNILASSMAIHNVIITNIKFQDLEEFYLDYNPNLTRQSGCLTFILK